MNFDKIINRKGTYCTQWDYIEDRFGKGNSDLTPFSISDTDFKCPQEIINKVIERVQHGIFGYSRWNHSDYKTSIVNWYKSRYKTNIKEDWVVYSPAVIYSISVIIEMIVGKSGKVMTHTPRYDGFTKILEKYTVYNIPLTENNIGEFLTDFDLIEKGFKDGVKLFLLCNPENPTGKVWKKEELEKLVELSKKYGVLIISDDIHMDIVRREVTPILKLDSISSLIVSSASKTFNTPSLGGSYCIIPDDNLRERFVDHIKNTDAVSSPAILGVISTMVAYNECSYWVDSLNEYLTKNCEYVVQELNGYKGLNVKIPEGTYLMWIDIKETNIDPKNLQEALIKIGKVAIMSGDNYGDKYRLRLNVGGSLEKIKIGVEGIKKAIDSLT
nr:aminotransferase class I/II-fold pyridoxal phosphate-dependent enzyme [uncultured Cetobacterium sp.]